MHLTEKSVQVVSQVLLGHSNPVSSTIGREIRMLNIRADINVLVTV